MKKYLLGIMLIGFALSAKAQQKSSSNLLHRVNQLQNPLRVLYLAAHPDDENTRMISWLANDIGAETAYLSLTRGDGGQNLIGTELGAQLGVLRTQELMQARNIDGGKQYFSRAVDFGYSKNPEETFKQWDREQVLSDAVKVIRQFRPHMIITRFPPDRRAGHGHHTASAMIALEAFDVAADPEAFPEHQLEAWQVDRIFWNHSSWWERNIDSLAASDPSYFVVDVGTYLPELGLSCNELASYSRSQHKSQGFGVAVARGSQKEYLKLMKGSVDGENIFDGLPMSWQDKGFKQWDQLLASIETSFDPQKPQAMLPAILEAIYSIRPKAGGGAWHYQWLLDGLSQLAADALGLKLELLAQEEFAVAGERMKFTARAIQRSPLKVRIADPRTNWGQPYNSNYQEVELIENEVLEQEIELEIPHKATSQPYWLREEYGAMFQVRDTKFIGMAETPPVYEVSVSVMLGERGFRLRVPARYKFSDRVEGEIERPLAVLPKLTASSKSSKLFFLDAKAKEIELDFRAFAPENYSIMLEAEGWELEPQQFDLQFDANDQVISQKVKISPKAGNSSTDLMLYLKQVSEDISGESYKLKPLQKLVEIDYSHIDKRVLLEDPAIKLIPLDLKKRGERVAYIIGAGDKVPEGIAQMGYQVDILDETLMRTSDLEQYQAVILGIRAYNTQDWLWNRQEQLMAYVEQGGTMIVQYNTRSRSFQGDDFAPYPFKISRERVTEERAAPRFTLPEHPVLNEPNKISLKDFEGWVQERGLYFADSWDEAYAAPIAWHDQSEPDRLGGLLIANHGQGAFIYTGISFFRELPAGVPGAYRLLANLISYQNGGE